MIKALCNFAPLSLYTGNPAPVILLPNSKSIISSFVAKSQCERAFSCKTGISPCIKTSRLFSSLDPLGTSSFGVFGISNSNEFNSFEIVESLRDKSLLFVFKFPAFSFKRVAFSTSPDLNKLPISFANLFDSERILSRLD